MSVAHRMADRLQELLQQRALIKEHLAWLESEISASAGHPHETTGLPMQRPALPASQRAVTNSGVSPRTALTRSEPSAPAGTDAGDELLAKLAAEEKQSPAPTKSGCWLFFCGALLLLLIGTWAAMHFFYR